MVCLRYKFYAKRLCHTTILNFLHYILNFITDLGKGDISMAYNNAYLGNLEIKNNCLLPLPRMSRTAEIKCNT